MQPMRYLSFSLFAVSFLVMGSLAGCCDCDEPTNNCETFAEVCHGLTEPVADECHKLGHAGDEEQCTARKDECMAACGQAGTGGGGGGGAGGSGGSGGSGG